MEQFCDLHTHSNCSDGTDTPEKLVENALNAGLSAVALCDHNTVTGLPRFLQAAKSKPIAAVPGVEVTCAYLGQEIHMLGLFVPENSYDKLTDFMGIINRRKLESNRRLVQNLSSAGYQISMDEVEREAKGAVPNRSHFAEVLIKKGYVNDKKTAIDGIMSERGGIYQPAERLDAFEVVRQLRALSALPVLAHPFLNLTEAQLREFLPAARECGLVGMECVYTLFTPEQTERAYALAEEFDLLPSGGSDYHGAAKAGLALGTGYPDRPISIPMEFYATLSECHNNLSE